MNVMERCITVKKMDTKSDGHQEFRWLLVLPEQNIS